MTRRGASYSSGKQGSGDVVSARPRSRKLTPTDGQFIVQAQACGLTHRQASELWAMQIGFAVARILEPHKLAQIDAAAERALRNTVARANRRAA